MRVLKVNNILIVLFIINFFISSAYGSTSQQKEHKYTLTNTENYGYDINCNTEDGCYSILKTSDTQGIEKIRYFINVLDNSGPEPPIYYEFKINGRSIKSEKNTYTLNYIPLSHASYANQQLIFKELYAHDVFNRVDKEELIYYGLNNTLDPVTITLQYTFDGWNKNKKMLTEKSTVSMNDNVYKNYSKVYDLFGRIVSKSYDLSGEVYKDYQQYDGADRAVVFTDFNQNITKRIFDGNGKLVGINYSNELTNLKLNDVTDIIYYYDNYGRIIKSDSISNNDLISVSYNINNINLVDKVVLSTKFNAQPAIKTQEVKAHYNYLNQLDNFTDYSQSDHQVIYGLDGQEKALNVDNKNISGNIEYEFYPYEQEYGVNQGKIKIVTQKFINNHYIHEQITSYIYNEIGLPKKIIYTNKVQGSADQVTLFYYQYDDLQRLVSVEYSTNQESEADINLNKKIIYSYDVLNRLIQTDIIYGSGSLNKVQCIQYVYDENNNIIYQKETISDEDQFFVKTVEYEYNSIDQLIKSSAFFMQNDSVYYIQKTFEYDSNGSLVKVYTDNKITELYEYNARGLLSKYTNIFDENKRLVQYNYYPNGKRFSKSEGDEVIMFLYNLKGNLINEELFKTDNLVKMSSSLGRMRYISDNADIANNQIQFLVHDMLNTPQDNIVFSNGHREIKSYNLSPYGNIEDQNTMYATLFNATKKINFDTMFEEQEQVYNSSYYDQESFLEYMNARYYAPDLKRFISQDSYDLTNRYSFSNANPIVNSDPSGHISIPMLDIVMGGSQMALGVGLTLSGAGYYFGNGMLISGTQIFVPGVVHLAQGNHIKANAKVEAKWYGVTLLSSFMGLSGEIYGGRTLTKGIAKFGLSQRAARKLAFIPNEWVAGTLYTQKAYIDPKGFFEPQTYLHTTGNYFLTAGIYESLLKPATLGSPYQILATEATIERRGLFNYAKNEKAVENSLVKNIESPGLYGVMGYAAKMAKGKNYAQFENELIKRDATKVANSRIYYTSRSVYRALLPNFHESEDPYYIGASSVGIAAGLILF